MHPKTLTSIPIQSVQSLTRLALYQEDKTSDTQICREVKTGSFDMCTACASQQFGHRSTCGDETNIHVLVSEDFSSRKSANRVGLREELQSLYLGLVLNHFTKQ